MQRNKHAWNKLAQKLSETQNVLIEHVGFFNVHVANRQLNYGQSEAYEFGRRFVEAEAVHFHAEPKYNSVEIFVQSPVGGGSGNGRFGRDGEGTFIELRRNNRTYSFALVDNHERGWPFMLRKALGELKTVFAAEYAEFIKRETTTETDDGNVVYLDGKRPQKSTWELDREFEQLYGKEFTDLFQYHDQKEFKDKCAQLGVKVLTFFRYTHSFRVYNATIKDTRNGIEFNWINRSTYHSLPNTLIIRKLAKRRELPFVKLATVGLETSGYYSHSVNAVIPKSQVKAAKAFFKKRIKVA